MTLTRVAPPATPPVALADLAEHARLSHGLGVGGDPLPSEDLALLGRCLDAATAHVERACALALIRQTWEWRLVRWPDADAAPLPLSPVLSILALERIDLDGAVETVDPATWTLDRGGHRPAIRSRRGPLPGPPSNGALLVRFEAGFGGASTDVPADLAQAVQLLAAHYFERRHAADAADLAELPLGVARLLDPHRPIRL